MSLPDRMIEIQKNIRENSENINQYFKDLYSWEKEIVKKDNQLRGIETQVPVVTNEVTNQKKRKEKKKKKKNESETDKTSEILKRDKASIKDYYDRWDKFNIEEKESSSEEEKVENKNKTVVNSTNYTQQYKPSHAQTNTNIVMRNNRMIDDNMDKVEKLKVEGNTHFSIGNYYKSLEAYTSALKLLEVNKNNSENYEKRKSQILNNRGNNYLKLSQYNDAINDLNIVLEMEHDNNKALYRRGLASYNLKKFRESLEDFYYLKEVGKNVDKDVNEYIEKCENEIKIRISEEMKKMKQFDPSENLQFHKINIKEISLEEISNKIENQEVPYNYLFDKTKLVPEQTAKPKIEQTQEEIKKPVKEIKIIETKEKEALSKSIEIPKEINYTYNEKNLTATSLKHSMKNYKNNMSEKIQFLLQINPEAIMKIFDSDFDREILCEILEILEIIALQRNQSWEKFILDFLRNITKIKRFKLVSKTLTKTDKSRITNIFDELKHTSESEILSIRDSFI